jgi:hypothetical protein
MQRMTAMLHANGIQTTSELTSLPWRSAGLGSFVMVSTEDYTKAFALTVKWLLPVWRPGGVSNSEQNSGQSEEDTNFR